MPVAQELSALNLTCIDMFMRLVLQRLCGMYKLCMHCYKEQAELNSLCPTQYKSWASELVLSRQACCQDAAYMHAVCSCVANDLPCNDTGEKEQRIVSLTAQLTTAYMKQAVAERRYAHICYA